jgi:hypothetical protein
MMAAVSIVGFAVSLGFGNEDTKWIFHLSAETAIATEIPEVSRFSSADSSGRSRVIQILSAFNCRFLGPNSG